MQVSENWPPRGAYLLIPEPAGLLSLVILVAKAALFPASPDPLAAANLDAGTA